MSINEHSLKPPVSWILVGEQMLERGKQSLVLNWEERWETMQNQTVQRHFPDSALCRGLLGDPGRVLPLSGPR